MAGRKKEPEPTRLWYRARSSGTVRIAGVRHTYIAGRTVVPQDHPLVQLMPSRFAPLRRADVPVVEIEPPPVVAEVPIISEPEIVVEDET